MTVNKRRERREINEKMLIEAVEKYEQDWKDAIEKKFRDEAAARKAAAQSERKEFMSFRNKLSRVYDKIDELKNEYKTKPQNERRETQYEQ